VSCGFITVGDVDRDLVR